ncbi:MAG: hypothetical protein RR851_15915 [Clostridium sp.]
MAIAFCMEEYLKEIESKDNDYLNEFGFVPLSEDDYEQLKELFDEYELDLEDKDNGFKGPGFIDLGYIPF